jgi:hypothetical protein
LFIVSARWKRLERVDYLDENEVKTDCVTVLDFAKIVTDVLRKKNQNAVRAQNLVQNMC